MKLGRRTLLAGTAGGILGAITAVVGIMWEIIGVTASSREFLVFSKYFTYPFLELFFAAYYTPYPSSSTSAPFPEFSIILAVLLIVTGVLTGMGFYYAYEKKGASVVGLIGSLGIALGALPLIWGSLTPMLGALFQSNMYGVVFGIIGGYNAFQWVNLISEPNWYIIRPGFIILGISFILLGYANIAAREEISAKRSASTAAGVLSILGAIPFLIGGLLFQSYAAYLSSYILAFLSVISVISIFVGFVIIFAAFIPLAVVFYTSRETGSPRKT